MTKGDSDCLIKVKIENSSNRREGGGWFRDFASRPLIQGDHMIQCCLIQLQL